jgi:hypothetical protein
VGLPEIAVQAIRWDKSFEAYVVFLQRFENCWHSRGFKGYKASVPV